MDNKSCSKCKKSKPFSLFSKRAKEKDGHSSSCKACDKEYDRIRNLKNKAEKQKRYLLNKDQIRQTQKEYYYSTREDRLIALRKKWARDKEKLNLWQKEYYKNNQTYFKGKNKAYRESEHGKRIKTLADNRRRALKLRLLHPDHDIMVENVLLDMRDRLSQCLGSPYHLDHIIPLSKGGWHYHLNLMPIPATLNLRKGSNFA